MLTSIVMAPCVLGGPLTIIPWVVVAPFVGGGPLTIIPWEPPLPCFLPLRPFPLPGWRGRGSEVVRAGGRVALLGEVELEREEVREEEGLLVEGRPGPDVITV